MREDQIDTWAMKSKGYKRKYFNAYEKLFEGMKHDKDCQVEGSNERVSGTSEVSDLANKDGD